MRPMPTAAKARKTSTAAKFCDMCLLTNRKLKNALITVPENIILVAPYFSDSFPVMVINIIVIIVSILRIQAAYYEEIFKSAYIFYKFVFI